MEKYVIDFLLIAIVAVSAIIAARKGFFLTLLSIISAIFALIGAKVFSTPVAQFVYDGFLRTPVLAKVQSLLPESISNADPQAIMGGVLEQLPDGVVALIEKYGLLDNAMQFTGDAVSFFSIENLEVNYIKPFCMSILSLLATVIVFYVLFVVFRLLARLLNRLIYKGKKQPVNRFLGAALGVVRAVIPVAVLTLLLNFAADYRVNDTLAVAVENSKICAWADDLTQDLFSELKENNPVVDSGLQVQNS